MMQFNNLRSMMAPLWVVASALILTTSSCTKVDDTLGSNLIPDNQQMKVGYTTLGGKLKGGELNPKMYYETRLYQTDSLISSNIGSGYMGSMIDKLYGLRSAGFMTQYISYYRVDSGYFGFQPIFDSAQLLLSMAGSVGDTITEQVFCVYEITDSKYIIDKPAVGDKAKDSTFYMNFDPVKAGAVAANYTSKPLFEFTLGGDNGPITKAVTLRATEAGKRYMKRLMLLEGKYKGDYSIYGTDSLEHFIKEFQGLYIEPKSLVTAEGTGTIYKTSLSASALSVYGRNRNPSDPSLIKDTVGMLFYFYDNAAEYGNVSINTIRHDYTRASSPDRIDIDKAKEGVDRTLFTNQLVMVEGMGGVVTELTLTQEFFDELEAIISKENAEGQRFTTMAVSQAKMSIYFKDSDYDWTNIGNMSSLIEAMDVSATRLGIYSDYKKLDGIEDYFYAFEQSQGSELTYGGKINRSRGCYTMDISVYLQSVWNSYEKLRRETPKGTAVDLSKVKDRTIYIGPEAYSVYTTPYTTLQGMNKGSNTASIKIDLTYNVIK